MFKPVSPKLNVTSMEENVLKFWKQADIFRKTVEQRQGAPEYVFYEGPPTANGKPGVHHVLARAFKDMFPRYKIMRGYHVSRRGGWDTHGLPVEIEVEKQLGFTNKQQIEEYGIEKFNELCKKSVFTYIQDWERLTDRIAFWFNLEDAFGPNRFEKAFTKPGAARFTVGMPNYPAVYAIRAGLEYIKGVSVERIDAHARPLVLHCLAELKKLPLELLTPEEPEHVEHEERRAVG